MQALFVTILLKFYYKKKKNKNYWQMAVNAILFYVGAIKNERKRKTKSQ